MGAPSCSKVLTLIDGWENEAIAARKQKVQGLKGRVVITNDDF
jgi:hypothetical protein